LEKVVRVTGGRCNGGGGGGGGSEEVREFFVDRISSDGVANATAGDGDSSRTTDFGAIADDRWSTDTLGFFGAMGSHADETIVGVFEDASSDASPGGRGSERGATGRTVAGDDDRIGALFFSCSRGFGGRSEAAAAAANPRMRSSSSFAATAAAAAVVTAASRSVSSRAAFSCARRARASSPRLL